MGSLRAQGRAPPSPSPASKSKKIFLLVFICQPFGAGTLSFLFYVGDLNKYVKKENVKTRIT